MASNKFVKGFMAVAATISVAALAGCPNPAGTPPTGGPSATPTGTPTTSPTATPSDQPTTPAPTALPSSADTQSVATIRGLVEDESKNRLDGVTITAKVLSSGATFANGSDSLTVTTVNGSYVLNGAPTGVIVEIVASKAGYSERRLAHTPLANTTGQGTVNDVDFTGVNALTDKPEVLSITPGDKTTGVDPATSFTMTFSTPMDKKTVEDRFQIKFNTIPTGLDGKFVGTYAPSDAAAIAQAIYDGSYFNKEWTNNNTVLTMTWKDSNQLITDKDSGDVPEYSVTFNAGVKNANGTQAADDGKIFRIGTQSKDKVTFTVAADTTKPQLDSGLVIIGSSGTNKARVKFNERMSLGTLKGAFEHENLLDASNYLINGTAATTAQKPGFYPDDQSKKTLEFDATNFSTGPAVIKAEPAVKDPAGNEIDKDYNEAKGAI